MNSLLANASVYFCLPIALACFLASAISLQALGESPSGSDFPTPINTEKSTTLAMSPEETVASAQVPDGFSLSLFAAEPDVQNPIACTIDERGRLWVAENYSWAGAGFGGFDGSQRDRILILEDTDGDGRFDTRKVFSDDIKKLTSIEIGNGGVWAISLPNLLFIPDTNRDDIPDAPPIVVLNGFDEGVVGHTPANGLKWGPDGWLYARHGILATSSIGVPEATDSQRVKINTGVWRFHPVTKKVEAVMHGMTNSWGFDFDQHGEMFVINTVIGHLWHVVPGAHVERMFGVDINPHSYQLIEQTADHVHWDTGEIWHEIRDGMSNKTDAAGGGHAHIGLMIYQGDNWPESYRNRLFTLNLHGRRLNSNSLERLGTAYVGKRAPDFCFVGDPWFRGMELLTGPDGGVFIADWSDTGECHDHDGVHRTSGRIYKLTHGQPTPVAPFDLFHATDEQLVTYLSHNNTWWARTARRILTERYSSETDEARKGALRSRLAELVFSEPDVVKRLRALETYYACGFAEANFLTSVFADTSEHVRVAALRFLSDRWEPNGLGPDEPTNAALQSLAKHDSSGLVSLYLASTLQRLEPGLRLSLANILAKKEEWKEDRTYPKMLWYGIESVVISHANSAIQLAGSSKIPLLSENIARRITQELELQPTLVEALTAAASEPDFEQADAVVRGMAKALEGWQKGTQPPSWERLLSRVQSQNDESLAKEIQNLRLVFGDGKAVDELMAMIGNGEVDPDVRKQALRSLAANRPKDFANHLFGLLNDRVLALEAIRGLTFFDHADIPQQLLNRWHAFGPAERKEAIGTLASRPAYARALMQGLREKKLSASDISAFHARQMASFEDEALNRELQELWGALKSTSEEKKQRIAQWKGKLSPETMKEADLQKGRGLFQQHCSNCHVLYGVGQKVGPDITGSHRSNLDYLLENILDPSASVGAEFRTVIVLLEDERVVNGVVVEQTDRTITLQTSQERVTIDRREIEEMKQSETSLMPDGLIQNMTDEQVRDLFGYLMHDQQVAL